MSGGIWYAEYLLMMEKFQFVLLVLGSEYFLHHYKDLIGSYRLALDLLVQVEINHMYLTLVSRQLPNTGQYYEAVNV